MDKGLYDGVRISLATRIGSLKLPALHVSRSDMYCWYQIGWIFPSGLK